VLFVIAASDDADQRHPVSLIRRMRKTASVSHPYL
jgi:hypothetical protein